MAAPPSDSGPDLWERSKAAKGSINDLDSATKERDDKRFLNVRAKLALAGYGLYRSNAADGPTSLFIERWRLVHRLEDLDAAEALLAQIGGQS